MPSLSSDSASSEPHPPFLRFASPTSGAPTSWTELEESANETLRVRCAMYNGTYGWVFAHYTASCSPTITGATPAQDEWVMLPNPPHTAWRLCAIALGVRGTRVDKGQQRVV